MTTKRPYAGVSADERRVERRGRLVEAALDLLAAGGPVKVTVTAVCAQAKLTERYFYESFSDREALITATFEQMATRCIAAMVEAVENAPTDPLLRIRAALTAGLEFVADDPRLERLALEAQHDDTLIRARLAVAKSLMSRTDDYARLFGARAESTRTTGQLQALLLYGGTAEILGAWLRGDLAGIARDELVDRCADMLLAVGRAFAG